MKRKSTLPKKKSILSMSILINELMNEYSKIDIYIKQARDILLDSNTNFFFVSFPLEHKMSSNIIMKYFNKDISIIKNDKQLHFLSPNINFSFKSLKEISVVTNELKRIYEINDENLSKEKKQSLLYKKKEYWDKYLFNFGEVTECIDSLSIQPGDFLMARELKIELNRIKDILSIINKFNSPKEKKKKTYNFNKKGK